MKGATGRNCYPKPQNPGFALVITLSLMVLLTIIAVGLLSLSTISLRGTTHAEAMATARANARMSLMLAIGELQKQAGPDQRVTGTADLAGTATGDPVAAGTAPLNNNTVNTTSKGLSSVQPGTRYWTGVWYQTLPPAQAATQIYTKTPNPVLKAWLISGNEGLSAANRLTPADTRASVGGNGEVIDTQKAVVLVGKNSAGTADINRYVGAPLVEIGSPAKKGKPAGRHGWWVGDEGVKAKFNQVPPENTGGEMTYETMGDRRAGWEAVDGFGDYPIPGADLSSVAKVVTLPEGGLLNESFAETGAAGSPMQRNFHAMTVDSRGLLVDNFNGGFRTDMTPYLAAGFPNGSANIIPTTGVAPRMRGPTWNRIKDFAATVPNLDSGRMIVKPAANDLGIAVAPIITELRFLLSARMVPVQGSPDSFKIYPGVKVAIALANPYPYPLKWNSPLQLEISNSQLNDPGINPNYQPACIFNAARDGAGNKPAYVSKTGGQPSVFHNAVFQIAADELPAGEAKAFTIAANTLRPANSTARVVVDLKPISPSSARTLDNCLELAHDGVNNLAAAPLNMDVREDWTTTQITADLKTGSGANTLLRRLERFELDNGFFAETTRNMTSSQAKSMTRPFPMHYYCFQYSQPGNDDYRTLLGGLMGLRSSTVRSFADFNPQAKRFHKPISSYNPPPYFMESADNLNQLPFSGQGGDTGPAFSRNLVTTPVAWGGTPLTTKKVILFTPQEKFVSLAQFQHADLTGDDTWGSVGHQPGNAFGNSYATPFVKRSLTVQNRSNYIFTGVQSAGAFTPVAANYYDLSYLLNTAVWDSYFLSAIPQSGKAIPESPAVVKIHPDLDSPDLRDAKRAAQHLMIDGAFNVNSTSKEAWKALLAGSKNLKHPADAGGGAGNALYPRSLKQTSAAAVPPSGENDDSYAGFRRLTDAQLDSIAEEMTRQVRMRGPFLSLSHFVNRALADIATNNSTADLRRKLTRSGAIQSALDEGGANINMAGTKNIFRDFTVAENRVTLQANGSSARADLDGTDSMTYTEAVPGDIPQQSKDLNPGAMASILADRTMLTGAANVRNEQGWRSTGIPGWITQADILQVIGPALAPRSDTFRIRAYGEATDPETGKPLARAWCEAIVQRMPEYVDGSEAASDLPAELGQVNKTFGRRFQAVSFKWLSKDEI